MSTLHSIQDLLAQEIKDLYSAETQLVKALPKMAGAASSLELREAIETHLTETETHVARLEEVAGLLGITPRGKSCKAIKGLLAEGEETIEEEGDPPIKDLALIVAAQKVEHYEICGYGSARALASLLALDDVAHLLGLTLDDEGDTDKTLTHIAQSIGEMIPSAA